MSRRDRDAGNAASPEMVSIEESGMTFGPFPATHLFHVESSGVYRKIQKDVRMVEFLWFEEAKSRIWAVEAKSSSPKPGNEFRQLTKEAKLEWIDGLQALDRSEQLERLDKLDRFEDFIAEIRHKLGNALLLSLAILSNRHPDFAGEIPAGFEQAELESLDFLLVLVMAKHPEHSLDPLQDALRKALRPIVKLWQPKNSQAVLVLNRDMARNVGLIA